MPSPFMSPEARPYSPSHAAVEEGRRAEGAAAVVHEQRHLVVADDRVDDVEVAVAVDVEHGDAVRLAPVGTVCELANVPSPAPRTIHTPPPVGGGHGEVDLAVVVEVRRLVRARLDADRERVGAGSPCTCPEPSARFREDAEVGADLVDGGEIDVPVVVQVGGCRAVDVGLRRRCDWTSTAPDRSCAARSPCG